MTPIAPCLVGLSQVVFAKDQPEYQPLPASVDSNGVVITCWKLSPWERLKLALGFPLWLSICTFKRPLQPLRLSLNKPEVA